MRAPIAKIRITAGNPGWYDPLTNTHLTITRPEALVYEGANLTNIKIGISHKLIYVIEGELDYTEVQSNPVVSEEPVREVIEPVEEIKEEDPVAEEEVKEEKASEEVVKEKKPAKKTTTKKKATKKTEETTK